MWLFQQNESVASRRDLFVQMVDGVDHLTPKTGLSLSVQLVKAGGTSYAAFAGSWSEVSDGTYRVRLAAADLDTLGQAMLKVTAGGAAAQYVPIQVVRFLDEAHLAKAALVNGRRHSVATGVNEVLDDDGATVLRTLTPEESAGVVSVVAS